MTLKEATLQETVHEQGGETYKVLVLAQEFMPTLPNFVGYDVPSKTLMISANNPADMREHMLWHEIACRVTHVKEDNCCVHVTAEEYVRVPEDRRAGYAAIRYDFYKALVPYHVAKNADPVFLANIRGSLVLWQGWARKR